jgi:multidrug efflux pump subunit AcrB
MARNHVAANLLMFVLIVGGLIKAYSIKQEVFPEIDLDRVQVIVAYPGAGPEEVEEGIILQVEENLSGVDGIKEIDSSASEGLGVVTAVLRSGEDADRVLQDIKSEVDRIVTFPEDAEKPVISKLLNRHEVISVVVYGDIGERALREQAERVRNDLLDMGDITQVDLGGVRPYEISIEVPEENLRRYNLTLEEVARRVRKASMDLPGGTIKTARGEILLRTKELRRKGDEYEDIAILATPDGTEVKLGEIGRVKDAFQETDLFARFNGKPAAMVRVFRVGEQKPIEISRRVKNYVEEKRKSLPPSVKISTWNDMSEIFKSRMALLTKNASYGLILVMITLGLFLEIRLAFWVMLGVPISFLGGFFIMPSLGVSINMISLFAFILALGILVDDAIVVGENVYKHRQMGKPFVNAAYEGAVEVGIPVIFSVLTTVAAFIPLAFVTGIMGKFIKVIPLVVISLLLVSLVESLFILPAHLSMGEGRKSPRGVFRGIERVRSGFSSRLDRFIAGPYRKFLSLCVRNRYATIAVGVALLFLTVGVVRGGILKFVFMPTVDGDVAVASIKMPLGTPVAETEAVEKFVVDKAMEVVARYDRDRKEGDSVLRDVYAIVGGTFQGSGPAARGGKAASHLGNIALFLTETKKRGVPATYIANSWREAVGEISGVDSLTFSSNIMHVGADIDIQLAHEDFGVLDRASRRLKTVIAGYPGVGDIEDTYDRGKRELKIRIKPEARTLGITEEGLGRQIRSAFYGSEALRLQRGRNEVRVMVRYPGEERKNLWDLESMRIRTPDGGEVPLGHAAAVVGGYGFSSIKRVDRKRVIDVKATVDSRVNNAGEILAEMKQSVLPDLLGDYPGLSFNMEGQEKERNESVSSMKEGFILALIAIYALLAIPFRSYSQPILIMAAIPFGIVGAVIGHLIMGLNLSILSMFGLVALTGVVVNDSLLLIDQVNRGRREGESLENAILSGGQRRFRPILLTSLTTFFGLAPIISETSVQAQFLIPMAVSLAFGILFATGITLLLIPSLYMILEDVKSIFIFSRVGPVSPPRGDGER